MNHGDAESAETKALLSLQRKSKEQAIERHE
jgi:hypothetical protein